MPVAPDLCGTVLHERYELGEVIGEGAFGRVYRGHDRRLDRPVAVKVIKPWWSQDPAPFAREARILARCSDPGVVQIFDVGDGPEGAYSVAELVDGEDLATRLQRGRPPVAEVRQIALGLCDGLAAAHALSIVHRDVKPANVLLAVGGRVKVTDFGVARLAEATSGGAGWTGTGAAVGTPRYMAPEQARGERVTAAADVYSAGAVLYEMLAGLPPFVERSPVALALAHLADAPPPLPATVPTDLRRVCARALAKDPRDRYADAGEMARALRGEDGGDGAATTRMLPVGASAAAERAAAGSAGAASAERAAAGSAGPAPSAGRLSAVAEPRAWAADAPAETLRAAGRSRRTLVDSAARRRATVPLLLALGLLAALSAAAVGLRRHPEHPRVAASARAVEVPLVVGRTAAAATAQLRRAHLRVVAVSGPAPGITPGRVTGERPAAGRSVRAGATVNLSVAEVPRWRTVTTFGGRVSPPITIRGDRWRLIVTATTGARHCTLVLFCRSSSASVTRIGQRAPFARFGVGGVMTRVLDAGPGTYRVALKPASGATRWMVRAQDDY